MKNIYLALFFIWFCLTNLLSQNIYTNSLIENLNRTGDSWEIIESDISDDQGHIRLNTNKWLMYFLHWRPLTKENSDITPEYVRNQLLTFWGPNMDHFSLKGTEGEIEINGHKAYYVDGDFMDGLVKTRFIIWNCHQTNRQFIADLNINKRLGTPDTYHEIQQVISKTIFCHGDNEITGGSILPKKYVNDSLNISFYKPNNWKTSVFDSNTWFPEGHNKNNGTLWTLPSDSEKQIDITWEKTAEKPTEKTIEVFFERMNKFEGLQLQKLTFDTIFYDSNVWMFSGKYQLKKDGIYKEKYSSFSDKYLFYGELWNEGGKNYFILSSVIFVDAVWRREVVLYPDRNLFEECLSIVQNWLNLENNSAKLKNSYQKSPVRCNIKILETALEVEFNYPALGNDEIVFEISNWANRDDYAKNVYELKAIDYSGNPLEVKCNGKRNWSIFTGNNPFSVYYYVKSNKESFAGENAWDFLYPTLLNNYVFAWGPTFLVIPADKDLKNLPVRLKINADSFKGGLYTNISSKEIGINDLFYLFLACGDFKQREIKIKDKNVRIIIEGGSDWAINYNELFGLVYKILEGHSTYMGIAPFDDQLIVSITKGSSTVFGGTVVPGAVSIFFNPSTNITDYNNIIPHLISHELFHLWNGHHLFTSRDKSFGYMLWFIEGFTDYYAHLTLLRNNIITAEDFINWLNNAIIYYYQSPFALNTSIENNPELFWTDEGFRDLTYRKGALIAFITDIKIRKSTEFNKNLDDFMKSLFFSEQVLSSGLTNELLLSYLNNLTPKHWNGFFKNFVIGTDELPFTESLKGLNFSFTYEESPDNQFKEIAVPQLTFCENNISIISHF